MLTALTDDALAVSRRGEALRLLPSDNRMQGCAAALLEVAHHAAAAGGGHVAQAVLARALSELRDPSGSSDRVRSGLSQTLLALCAVDLPPPDLDRTSLRLEVFTRAAERPFARLLAGERAAILRRIGESHGVSAARIDAWLFSDVPSERLLSLPAWREPEALVAAWHRLTLATLLAGSLSFRIEVEGFEQASSRAVDAVAQAFAAQGLPRVVERAGRVWRFCGLGAGGVKARKRRLAQALIQACADLPLERLHVSLETRWKDGKLVVLDSQPSHPEAAAVPSTLLQARLSGKRALRLALGGDEPLPRAPDKAQASAQRSLGAARAAGRATASRPTDEHAGPADNAPQLPLSLSEFAQSDTTQQQGWVLSERAAWPIDEVVEQEGARTLIQHVELWYPRMFAPWSPLRLPGSARLAVRLTSAASLLAPKGSPRALLGHIEVI